MLGFRRLSTRLSVALLLLLLALGAAYFVSSQWVLERHRLEVSQSLHQGLAASLIKEYPVFDESGVSADGLEHVFHTLMAVNPAIEVYLLDPGGAILKYSAPYKAVELERVDVAPIRRFVEGRAAFPITGENPRAPGRQNVFSAAPVRVEGQLMGYLYVVLGGDEVESVEAAVGAGTARRLSLATVAALVGFGMLTGLIVFQLLTVRLRRLDRAMQRFAGECESDECRGIDPPARRNGDEIDRLTGSFADLTHRVTEQMDTIKRSDRLRRQLVANVSHDFRTPLAALDGYLQTLLLKGESLTVEERRQYLEIAAKSGQRLTRLVKELFELSRLEAEDREAQPEPFCLSELVSDVLAKFALRAEQKSLTLELDAAPEASHAYAEIGLIERVLENLIANAISHTPDGGFVRVSVAPANDDSVRIAVQDSGSGISERELPHIFERFYRASRNDDRRDDEGSGLGLAIVKRIIELHRSRIVAQSRRGRGSSFVFWLPATEAA